MKPHDNVSNWLRKINITVITIFSFSVITFIYKYKINLKIVKLFIIIAYKNDLKLASDSYDLNLNKNIV